MKKFMFGMFSTLCIIITVVIFVGMFARPDAPKDENLTEAENFAKNNGISVKLAESIEYALSQSEMPDSLESLRDWEQMDDYAEGQRYKAWSYSVVNERHYYMVFYVKDDVVESIRDSKYGLEVLYSK